MKRTILLPLYFLIVGLMLVACGGGGGGSVAGGGIGGTGITTSGTVTGFGSVFVNGVEYETSGASFDVDDDAAAVEGDLGIGMVVTVIGTVNDDGVSGSADSIEYDEAVEGPIAAEPVEDLDMVTKMFDVFDITIVVDRNSTVFVGTDYESLEMNDIVEVSGFFDEFGILSATRLEKEGVLNGSTEVEVKGTVSGCDGDCSGSFTLGSLDITYDGGTDLSEMPGGVVTDGQFVEVKGDLTPPSTIAALRIELEEEGLGDDIDKVSIEGIVSDFFSISNFKVSGQQVDASDPDVDFLPASLAGTIGDGDEVEVEGPIVGGVLQATEVEQRGGDIKVKGKVVGVDIFGSNVLVEVVSGQPSIEITLTSQTQLEDERDEMDPFALSDININDELIIEGFIEVGSDIVATQIKRKDLEQYELQGPADVPPTSGSSASGSVSVLGVTIVTNSATDFEDVNDGTITGTVFYTGVSDGDLVEFEDINDPEDGVDGIADEVGFED